MAQVVVAVRQPLCIVSQLVLPQQADGSSQADLNSEIDQHVFEPLRALKTVVYELAMAPQRVAKQQYDTRGTQEDSERRPRERRRPANRGPSGHGDEPRRFDRGIANLAIAHTFGMVCCHPMRQQAVGQDGQAGSH